MYVFLKNEQLAKLLLRLGVGGMMLLHGIAKVGSDASAAFIKGSLMTNGLPTFLYYGVFIGELLAPLLIIAGLYSRIGGLLVAGNMVFAIFLVHMSEIFKLNGYGGWEIELQMFYLLGGLCIAFLGSGRYAIKPD